jgi:hypothetical protein
MTEYSIFFVLNGLQDGERGVYAKTAGWNDQMADGWYYLDGDTMRYPDGRGPFESRDDAVEAAEKDTYGARADALPVYLKQAIKLLRANGYPINAIKLLRETGDYGLLEAKKICEHLGAISSICSE